MKQKKFVALVTIGAGTLAAAVPLMASQGNDLLAGIAMGVPIGLLLWAVVSSWRRRC